MKTSDNKRTNIRIKVSIILGIVALSLVLIVSYNKGLFGLGEEELKNTDEIATVEIEEIQNITFDDYMEQPKIDYSKYKVATKVKGLFTSVGAINTKTKRQNLIKLANETEINAFVIDVKDDTGYVSIENNIPLVKEVGSDKYSKLFDTQYLMDTFRENDIYPIARIVCFKDPYLAKARPDLAIKNKDGSVWKYKGIAWLNPYNEDNWKYIVDVAKAAAEDGFKEIQFDYIRFEATIHLQDADFGVEAANETRREVITEFIDYATSELEPYGVDVAADVFGTIITSEVDAKRIGQDYVEMAKRLDVICPMIYPSHYGYGFFGIPAKQHSDLYPYETIYGSMLGSAKRYEEIAGEDKAIVRPWLQAFTASYLGNNKYIGGKNYMKYGEEAIRAQIQGAYDAGLEEWILWNSGGNYTGEGLLKE